VRELPSGWAWVRLGGIVGTVDKGEPSKLATDEFRYIDISAINGLTGIVSSSTIVKSADAPTRARQMVNTDDVLFSTVRPALRKIARVPFELDGAIASTGFAVLRPGDAIESAYLFLLVRSAEFIDKVAVLQRGVSYPAVRPADLLNIKIAVPPRSEQARIIDSCDRYLEQLTTARASTDGTRGRLERLRATVTDRIVLGQTGTSTNDSQFHSPPSGKHKRFRYEDLPELPKSWRWRLAGDVCEDISSGSTPSREDMSSSGDIPLLKVYNIDREGFIDFEKNLTFISVETHRQRMRRSIVRPGDVVTNIVGPPLGKTAVMPERFEECNINQAIVRYRSGSAVSPAWLAICLRSPIVTSLLSNTARATAGQLNISLSTCRELPLPVPPRSLQDALTFDLQGNTDAIERLLATILRAQVSAETLRERVVRAAIRGQLIDQDLADEPADLALARIRAEREATAPTKTRRPSTRKATTA